MHHDVPAALPLTALIAGLALGPFLVNPIATTLGLVAIALLSRHRTAVAALLFIVLGVLLARRPYPIPIFEPDRFVTIEVPMERDWAERDTSYVLRASHFRANGVEVEHPIAVFARFEPPEIAMEAILRAEVLIRVSEFGTLNATIKAPQLMSYEGRLPWWHPAAWNRALANRLERHAGRYPEEVALAQALLLGRGERLTEEMRDSFRRGGTYHLLVFSGLQIAFAAGVLAALLRWMRAPRASDWLLLAFSALAPPFIGWTASVSRASIAIGLYALSRILKRPTSLENLWCVAALGRLLLEPRDLTDVSFHLTYAGAGALIFIGKHFRRPYGHLAGAELAIAPITLHHFRQYALGGSVVTLAMAPAIFAMLVVSAIACAWPHDLAFRGIGLLHRFCIVLNHAGVAGWFASPPLLALFACAAIALGALCMLRGRRRAIAIMLALLIPIAAAVAKSLRGGRLDAPRVTFLDVGQGDAIAIRARGATILVDGGRGQRVLRLLADRGVRQIDAAVLTHAHPDHCAGLARVVREMRVRSLWLSPWKLHGECADLMLRAASESRTPIHLVRDGETLEIGGIHVTAHLAELRFRRAPENNSSVVLRVGAEGRTFLLTGDIEKEAELAFHDRDFRADVLKVAHHGSRSSTGDAFLRRVQPKVAVISCGRRNLFGHPHPDVLAALARRGSRVRRTDRDGSIDVDVRDGRLYVRSAID